MSLSKQAFEALLNQAEKAQFRGAFLEKLAPYKVDNAVLLAAGLSSRFAPLSYDLPKGLLTVKGEVLIERQIRQLKEAGISEIYVVVGYKRELFFYLEDKFDVQIIYNPEYAKKNNVSSMWRVRDKLCRSYICSADNYFDENPFKSYVYRSYYTGQYSTQPTHEWIMKTDEDDLINHVQIGGDFGWYMIGEAYFDATFSSAFLKILESEYHLSKTANKLWEDVYIDHIGLLKLYLKKNEHLIAHEFDNLDELVAFDSRFLENVDSDIFNNICKTLNCSQTEIHDVYPLDKSLTNLSFHFATNSNEYVYRHPGIGTEDIIDREAEKRALEVARNAGFDRTYIYENAQEGWKISYFVKDAVPFDAHNKEALSVALDICRRLHQTDIKLPNTFEYAFEAQRYEKLILQKGPIRIPEYKELAAFANVLSQKVENEHAPKTINHNDFFALNFLIEEDGTFNLIDWEYAGMGDYANDLATLCVCCELSELEIDWAIAYYFENKCTENDIRHVYALIGLCGWCWYLWSILKEREGDNVGKWLYVYYHYAKLYIKRALELYD